MRMPLVSVIVPVYKVEEYINKCIDSILSQTYENIEVIIVDDGSPDNCPKICDEYAKKDNRIKVIHKANGGLSDARNAGLDIAKGEFIAFVDSDDYISLNMLQIMIDEFRYNDCDVCICENYTIRDDKIMDEKEKFEKRIFTNQEAMKITLSDEIGSQSWRYISKKCLWDNVRFPVGRRYEDLATTHLMIKNSTKTVYISDRLYYYLHRNQSISFTQIELNSIHVYYGFKERYYFSKKYYPQLSSIALSLVVKFALNLYNSSLNKTNALVDQKLIEELYSLLTLEYKNIIKAKEIPLSSKIKVSILKVSKKAYKFVYTTVKKKE